MAVLERAVVDVVTSVSKITLYNARQQCNKTPSPKSLPRASTPETVKQFATTQTRPLNEAEISKILLTQLSSSPAIKPEFTSRKATSKTLQLAAKSQFVVRQWGLSNTAPSFSPVLSVLSELSPETKLHYDNLSRLLKHYLFKRKHEVRRSGIHPSATCDKAAKDLCERLQTSNVEWWKVRESEDFLDEIDRTWRTSRRIHGLDKKFQILWEYVAGLIRQWDSRRPSDCVVLRRDTRLKAGIYIPQRQPRLSLPSTSNPSGVSVSGPRGAYRG
ncbi:hypothetical protein MMC28_003198 [Mycoblastus sanguinarius]|nr:hypothetical protein [Mycoblastus sanguinarius]